MEKLLSSRRTKKGKKWVISADPSPARRRCTPIIYLFSRARLFMIGERDNTTYCKTFVTRAKSSMTSKAKTIHVCNVSIICASVVTMKKSRDVLSVALKGQALKPCSSTGKHLTFNKNVSQRPILRDMALNDLLNDFLELSKTHFQTSSTAAIVMYMCPPVCVLYACMCVCMCV